jgi:hypothetical protein
VEQYPEGREIPLTNLTGQSIVISEERITSITLPLRNLSAAVTDVVLRVRQATHLRDFGGQEPVETDIRLTARVEPGFGEVTFVSDAPVIVLRDRPVVLLLEPNPTVSWSRTWFEPPGTQAAHWDDELGYWRWEHGTLGVRVAPITEPYGPAQVVSGVTRPERTTNVWISDPRQALPQWWEISWPEPQLVASVELTFDSQLSGWIWEGAFPMIVKDYEILAQPKDSEEWITIDGRMGNVQRRVVHAISPIEVTALRVVIHQTNGGRTARLVEFRAYGPDGRPAPALLETPEMPKAAQEHA